MDEVEIPQYFLCPISLEMMKDPVTAVTGITYERESIERWIVAAAKDSISCCCPVTKQPLPKDPNNLMTPNHTLRRLIQAWCVANAANGVDRIPTPKSAPNKSHVRRLIRELALPHLYMESLETMGRLAANDDRACMVEAGAIKAMVLLIIRCSKQGQTLGLCQALRILHLIWSTPNDDRSRRRRQSSCQLVTDNFVDLIDSMLWVLQHDHGLDDQVVKTHAMWVLKTVIKVASSKQVEGLELDFFKQIVRAVIRARISQQATKAALEVLIEACAWGHNNMKIIEARAVFELVELELSGSLDKRTTELVFCLLAHLCSCAGGREHLLSHAGGIATVAKRILRVSSATDDRAVHILALICRYSATRQVLLEMLRVGGVSKLCMVLQADSELYLKKNAREVLRLHSSVWNSSPCIAVYLLTKDPR